MTRAMMNAPRGGNAQQARLDFIARFVTEYANLHGREECVHAAGALIRLAKRRLALAMVECNPPDPWKRYSETMARRLYEDWEESVQRRKDKLLGRVRETCAPFALPYESQGDPRGPCLRVKFPTANGHTGVPT